MSENCPGEEVRRPLGQREEQERRQEHGKPWHICRTFCSLVRLQRGIQTRGWESGGQLDCRGLPCCLFNLSCHQSVDAVMGAEPETKFRLDFPQGAQTSHRSS